MAEAGIEIRKADRWASGWAMGVRMDPILIHLDKGGDGAFDCLKIVDRVCAIIPELSRDPST
jgi:hypothetical protein